MNTPINFRAVLFAALFIGLAVFAGSTALAADQTNGRQEGSLINVADFAKLKDEIASSQQAAQTLVDSSPVTIGRERLNAMNDALDGGDDAAAADIYKAEMDAGRGPEFWRRQGQEFGAKETELLGHFDRLQRFYREARRNRPAGTADGAADKLDELARSLADSRSSGASGKLRAMLAAAKQERAGAAKAFAEKYRYAAAQMADSAENLPIDVLEEILLGVVEQAVAMGDAKASARRAEAITTALPDELRRRAKQKAAGQSPKPTAGNRKLF